MSFDLNNESLDSDELRELEAVECNSVRGGNDAHRIDSRTTNDSEEENGSNNSKSDELIQYSVCIEARNCGKDIETDALNDVGNEQGNEAVNETVNVLTNDENINNTNPSGGGGDQSVDDDGEAEKNLKIMCKAIEQRLAVGSILRDLEQAYLLYCEYGRLKGFGVRRGEQRYIGKTDDVKWKDYVCSCAGNPDEKSSTRRVPNYRKLVMRTGCKAKLRLSRTLSSPWKVTIFESEHNHGLLPTEMTYMLRSSRNLTYAQSSILEALHSAGIGVNGACGFMERECGGPQNLGFTRRDAYDHFVRNGRKSKLENGDSNMLWSHFIKKSKEDPFFYWNAEKDEEGRLMNFFFRDGRNLSDYETFSEVLSVDTTYSTNKYNLICAPFVGINHHSFTCMFGIGFLSDETTTSFEWLFKEFLVSMKGIHPKVIFTDQCVAMMNAIDKMFPESKHRLCQWHINRNATKRFGSLNGNAAFKKLWHKCMTEVETEDEFDATWKELMSFTNPSSKSQNWFKAMYKIRHRWASVFTRGIFTAGPLSTSRSEGANRCVKATKRCTNTLIEFVENYEKLKIRWRQRETEEDALGIFPPGQLVGKNELFTQAASCYTRNVYKKFEAEAMRSWNVVISHHQQDLGDGNLEIYAKTASQSRSRRIVYNKDTNHASCSCRKWESEGILCHHLFKVYYYMNNFSIPESLILKRWTKNAKDGRRIPSIGTDTEMGSSLPNLLFLNTIIRQLYNVTDTCLERADCCRTIKERIDELADEIYEMTGQRKVKPKWKAVVDLKYDDSNKAPFGDPKPIEERGFSHARNCRTPNAVKKKGFVERKKGENVIVNRKTNDTEPDVGTADSNKNKPRATTSGPRVPFQVSEQSNRNQSLYHRHSAGFIPDDRGNIRRLSQP